MLWTARLGRLLSLRRSNNKMKIREVPIKFSCNCPKGNHKCYMHRKKIIPKNENEAMDKMHEVQLDGERFLLNKK